jgi:hypothetical protein
MISAGLSLRKDHASVLRIRNSTGKFWKTFLEIGCDSYINYETKEVVKRDFCISNVEFCAKINCTIN